MQVALPEPLPQDLKARFPVQMPWTYPFDVGRIQTAVTTCANSTSRVQLGSSSRSKPPETLLEFRVSCRMKMGC